jgi:NitT/TauT family transport system substrate-binding protein
VCATRAWRVATVLWAAIVLAPALAWPQAPELTVSIGGGADDPAYLPVHAAAALGTFDAEGVHVTVKRVKHPTAALSALRDGEALVAVTTADQAVRGAWARGAPVRILVAHTRAPAVALLVSAKHRGEVSGVADLRGKRVGIPGPGTTGHLVLSRLLREIRLEPTAVGLVSLGASALLGRLGSGELDAAVLEEPWVTRAVALGVGGVLLDFRRPADAARQLGGPFYEFVSVARADEKALAKQESALAAYARAVIRVQAWLATAPAGEIAERLPASLRGDAGRFVERLGTAREAYVPDGQATEAGLRSTLEVLRAGSPWPVKVEISPEAIGEPAFVTAARAALGGSPPVP